MACSGCATTLAGPDSLAGSNAAIIQSADPNVRIMRLDRHGVGGFGMPFSRWGSKTKMSLSPGKHLLHIGYFHGPNFTSNYQYRLTVEAGHVYMINNEVVERGPLFKRIFMAKIWIVDRTSPTIIDEVVASELEPITKETEPFRQSMYFSWAPPKTPGWTVLSRDPGELVAAVNNGPSESENTIVTIQLIDLPSFKDANETSNYFKQRMELSPDAKSGRFEVFTSSVSLFERGGSPCVRYSRSLIDRNPGYDPYADPFTAVGRKVMAAFRTDRPIMTQLYGFACRIPKNENRAVDLRFSDWAFERKDEAPIASSAEEAFKGLSF